MEAAKNLISFEEWLGSLEKTLTDLFAAFAVLHIVDPTKSTVSMGVGPLCKQVGRHSMLCDIKTREKIVEILKIAGQSADEERVSNIYREILDGIRSREFPHRSVSGKDFLLPLLLYKLHSIDCKISRKTLRRRLALSCDLSAFQKLKADTLSIAAGAANY